MGGAAGGRGGGGGARGGGRGDTGGAPIPSQDAAQVSANWPAGSIDVRMSPYLLQAQQKWMVTPVPNAGGFPGSPYFKITIAGTERALTATEDGEVIAKPTFTGGSEQLWRIEQLTDGSYRVMPKAIPNSQKTFALSAIGTSKPTLSTFNSSSDRQRWLFKTP